MSCQFDYYYNIDRKPDKLLIGNIVYYLTNPDKINKTACDLLSNQMDCCIPTHLISLHPSNWKMVYGIALRLRLFAGSCNRDKVSSTMIFVTSSQIGVLKKQFTQKWNICHYLLLNAALFHPVQVDQRLSQCHWKRAAHTFYKTSPFVFHKRKTWG